MLDQALLSPTSSCRYQIQQLIPTHQVKKLAERLRMRATILAKQQPRQREHILEARDALILAHMLPPRHEAGPAPGAMEAASRWAHNPMPALVLF
jgi:hypothetical protein